MSIRRSRGWISALLLYSMAALSAQAPVPVGELGPPASTQPAQSETSLAPTPPGSATTEGVPRPMLPEPRILRFDSFGAMRNEVLNLIGAATRRLRIVTNYLTDGEIIAALYLAQYRGLDVQVHLGRQKAYGYMSRLRYLKENKIPVFLRDHGVLTQYPTIVEVDNTVVTIDGELDFMARNRLFRLERLTDSVAQQVQRTLAGGSGTIPHDAPKLPLVGRPRGGGAVGGGHWNPRRLPEPSAASLPPPPDGAYRYNRHHTNRPAHVPATLPRETIQQKRDKVKSTTLPDPVVE